MSRIPLYDETASVYHTRYITIQREKYQVLVHYLYDGPLVDIGVGTGIGLPFLKDFSSVVGVDGSIGMLKIAQQQIIGDERNQEWVSLVCASATALPFRSDIFSSVVCVTVIQNIQELDKGVEELLRIIHPLQGRIGLTWLARVLSMNQVVQLVTDKVEIVSSLHNLAGEDDGLILQRKPH